jgi:hypothetical protein
MRKHNNFRQLNEGSMKEIFKSRRKTLTCLLGVGLSFPITSFSKGSFFMSKVTTLDVVIFNYIDRPIFDVYLNGEMIGGSAALSKSPYGQFGTVVGVKIPFGPQKLTWRLDGPAGTARNGDTITASNSIILPNDAVTSGSHTLGVHIYPDDTAELIVSNGILEQTERGLTFAKKFQKNGK